MDGTAAKATRAENLTLAVTCAAVVVTRALAYTTLVSASLERHRSRTSTLGALVTCLSLTCGTCDTTFTATLVARALSCNGPTHCHQ